MYDLNFSAWPVNFNMPLDSFEPSIRQLRELINLALSSVLPSPPRLIFVSSVGVIRSEHSSCEVGSQGSLSSSGCHRRARTSRGSRNCSKRSCRQWLQRSEMGMREYTGFGSEGNIARTDRHPPRTAVRDCIRGLELRRMVPQHDPL